MHVALCHDAIIPPQKYGGTERIVYWLAKALRELGHEVTLVAKSGSQPPLGARFISTATTQPWEQLVPENTDIMHLWATPSVPPTRPFVVTIEGNGRPGEIFHPNTLFISKKHAENHGAEYFVYNGIDVSEYTCAAKRGGNLAFLAKANWKVKNLKGAIAIARRARVPLEVMGSRDWPLGVQKFLPRIQGVRLHGMVDDTQKRAILAGARALLFPVRWHEPFGIALVEALASGCAILGSTYGSLPEIVTKEVGVLSNVQEELVQAVHALDRFSPERCRARAEEVFSHLVMARSYLRFYENILTHGRLGSTPNLAPRAGLILFPKRFCHGKLKE